MARPFDPDEDLPGDFEFDAITPTVPALRSEPGKIEPDESVRRYLSGATASVPPDAPEELEGEPISKQLLADLLDEKLSRRAVREIQSSFKDAHRFDTWVALLQERVPYDDPIVLPFGEGLNIVRRRSDGELVIRTDSGADLCPWNENWKMHAGVFVRDTPELMREIYPEWGHADPDWMELREYYDPASGRLLEVEALPPGYPVVHDFVPDLDGFYRGWLGRGIPS